MVTVSTDGNTYTVATDKTGGSAPVQVAATAAAQTAAPVAVTQQQNAVPASSGSVAITALNLQGETVKITNSGSSPVNRAGWKLTDEGAKHSYTFTKTTVPPDGSMTVTSRTASGDLKWTSTNIWNNEGDTAYLDDGSGQLVSQKKG